MENTPKKNPLPPVENYNFYPKTRAGNVLYSVPKEGTK